MALQRMPKGSALKVYVPSSDDAMEQVLPTVVEFLTRSSWQDGALRQRGSLMVIWEDGNWKVWLNDRDAERSAWLTADTLMGVLATAESQLAADRVPWRPAGFTAKQRK